MEGKITFEDLGIEFTDDDFEGVSKETLRQCKERIEKTMNKLEEKSGKKDDEK